jgi:CRISPR-associated protein Csb2
MRLRFIPLNGAQSWYSVTPVVLPGFLLKGGRSKKEPEAAFNADMLRRKRALELAEKALWHAGLDPERIAITRLQLEPFRARDKRADDDWTLPISQQTGKAWLSQRPRVHIELTAKEPIQGPLVIGDGRFLGLGLFAADVPTIQSQANTLPKEEFPTINGRINLSVQFMLLSMTTQSGNDRALPPVTRTLPQAELLHRALTSFVTRNGGTNPVLTGCDDLKRPLKGPHDHAHILPLDLDDDGHLDHVLIWAPKRLDGSAQNAIRAIRRTYTKGGIEPLRLALVGAGRPDDLILLPDEYGRRLGVIFGPRDGARKWRSLTPFVAPRYLKKNGGNTLIGQVTSELAARGFPEPVEVGVLEAGDHPEFLRHRHFIRKRRSGPQPPADFGYSLEIGFDKPIFGPLCLGYGSHFGLGLFGSVD